MSPDLSQALGSLIQIVPIWTFVGIAVKYWIDRSRKTAEEFKDNLNMQFKEIRNDMKIAHHAFGDAVHRIELKLANSGIDDLRENIEDLKDSRARQEMRLEAAFRILDQFRLDVKG